MKTSGPPAIRLTRTPEVAKSLALAKRRYPTLSDPEILKLALANLTVNTAEDDDLAEVRAMTAHAFSIGGYLDDPNEDIYHLGMGKKVSF
jgi:hypothetical protein